MIVCKYVFPILCKINDCKHKSDCNKILHHEVHEEVFGFYEVFIYQIYSRVLQALKVIVTTFKDNTVAHILLRISREFRKHEATESKICNDLISVTSVRKLKIYLYYVWLNYRHTTVKKGAIVRSLGSI